MSFGIRGEGLEAEEWDEEGSEENEDEDTEGDIRR